MEKKKLYMIAGAALAVLALCGLLAGIIFGCAKDGDPTSTTGANGTSDTTSDYPFGKGQVSTENVSGDGSIEIPNTDPEAGGSGLDGEDGVPGSSAGNSGSSGNTGSTGNTGNTGNTGSSDKTDPTTGGAESTQPSGASTDPTTEVKESEPAQSSEPAGTESTTPGETEASTPSSDTQPSVPEETDPPASTEEGVDAYIDANEIFGTGK